MQDGVFFAVDLNGTDGPKVEQGEIRTRGDAMVKLERETGKFAPAFTVKNSSWLPVVSSPIVVGNRLVFCDFFGIFKQVNVRTGRVVMEMHLPTSPTSSFTFVEGALYFGGDSCLYELK